MWSAKRAICNKNLHVYTSRTKYFFDLTEKSHITSYSRLLNCGDPKYRSENAEAVKQTRQFYLKQNKNKLKYDRIKADIIPYKLKSVMGETAVPHLILNLNKFGDSSERKSRLARYPPYACSGQNQQTDYMIIMTCILKNTYCI